MDPRLERAELLAGGVSRDFEALLGRIEQNVEHARRAEDPEERDAFLAAALVACSRAQELTEKLRAFGQKQALAPSDVDLNELVRDTLSLFERLLPESIAVEIHALPEPARVQGDRDKLEQVLVSLCVNARDAMPAGGRLSVGVRERGRDFVVSVRDTGAGIQPELLERVFEPFFSTKPSAAGLGLASANGIVKQHGGALRVDSDLGRGSTFELHLPKTSPLAEPESLAVRGGSETLLCAEADPMVSYVVIRILEGAGYRVLAAEDAPSALLLFERESASVALCLLCADMPDLARDIRALRPNVGVVVGTEGGEAALPPFDTVVTKPYDPDELLAAVRGVLDARARFRAAHG